MFPNRQDLKTYNYFLVHIKMERHTVKQLRVIAKERGIKRYSALRKAKLIEAINAHGSADNHNLLNAPVPDISAPVLTPVSYTHLTLPTKRIV